MIRRQVFFNCNRDGVLPASVAIFSLLKAADPESPLDVFLAHDGEFANLGGCKKVAAIAGMFPFAHVHFASFDSLFERHRETLMAENMRWPPMVWAWCFCTELFPELTGNLVYLDWDMYVLKDLKPLYELDLKKDGFIAAAVNESRREHRPYLVAAGWPEAAGYAINTGTQVIDTDAYRSEHILEKILDWYTKYKDVSLCVDQDAINAVAGERIRRLHIKYNFTVGWCDRIMRMNPLKRELRVYPTQDVFAAVTDPVILHFIGKKKPWRWNHRPFRNLYRKTMAELGLFDRKAYGETAGLGIIGAFFDLYHAFSRLYAKLILTTVLRNRPQSP